MTNETLSLPLTVTRGRRLVLVTPVVVLILAACIVMMFMAEGVKLYGIAAVIGTLFCVKMLIAWIIVKPAQVTLEKDVLIEKPYPFMGIHWGEEARHTLDKFDHIDLLGLHFLPGILVVHVAIMRGKDKKDDLVLRPWREKFTLKRRESAVEFARRLGATYNLQVIYHA